jgi:hypothetical protein
MCKVSVVQVEEKIAKVVVDQDMGICGGAKRLESLNPLGNIGVT